MSRAGETCIAPVGGAPSRVFGPRFPAVALRMRARGQKGTGPYLGHPLTWVELLGVPISAPPLTSWASHFTSLGSVSSPAGLLDGHTCLVDRMCPVNEIVCYYAVISIVLTHLLPPVTLCYSPDLTVAQRGEATYSRSHRWRNGDSHLGLMSSVTVTTFSWPLGSVSSGQWLEERAQSRKLESHPLKKEGRRGGHAQAVHLAEEEAGGDAISAWPAQNRGRLCLL